MEGVYRNNKATGWTLALVLPKAELFAAARKIGLINLGISIVVVVVLAIALLYLTRVFVTKPLAAIAAGLKDIAQGEGDLTSKLEINSEDEIGEVAHWFNTFEETLATLLRQVANNVETLTSSGQPPFEYFR